MQHAARTWAIALALATVATPAARALPIIGSTAAASAFPAGAGGSRANRDASGDTSREINRDVHRDVNRDIRPGAVSQMSEPPPPLGSMALGLAALALAWRRLGGSADRN